MQRENSGFTLIELICVIVVLGVLAATALPKFIDLKGDAQDAALSALASAMGEAMRINYAGCVATNQVDVAGKCAAIADCDQVGKLLQGGSFPEGYYVLQSNLPMRGATASCTVVQVGSGKTASFEGVGTVNN